jgi:hypothetical protein
VLEDVVDAGGILQRVGCDLVFVRSDPEADPPSPDAPMVGPWFQGGSDVAGEDGNDVQDRAQVLGHPDAAFSLQRLLKLVVGRLIDPRTDHGDRDSVGLPVFEGESHSLEMAQLLAGHPRVPL